VVLAGKDEEPVNAAADKLTAARCDATAAPCDVTDDVEVASMLERTANRYGRLDAAFNNAGIMRRSTGSSA
jgi:NAD(P)-dependent dehydrogenase (short-subunit alcohol dehydrogenase family)